MTTDSSERTNEQQSAIDIVPNGTGTDFDCRSHTLTVTLSDGRTVDLQQTPDTIYGYSDPNELPPGTCSDVGTAWNHPVPHTVRTAVFAALLGVSAHARCNVTFQAGAEVAPDIFTLVEVAPAP